MTKTKEFDLIVVGASFAGLRCAAAAALRGLRVGVIDQKPRAGARVRTTGIFVQEAADELDFPARLSRKIKGVRLYAPKGEAIDLASPGYAFQATDTPALLDWMAEETGRAGAELMFGRAFTGATRTTTGFALDGLNIAAQFLVGADGAKSRVAQALNLSRNRHFLYGVEIGVPNDTQVSADHLHCFVSARHAPGYIAWAVPGPAHLQIGLATSRGRKPAIDDVYALVRKNLGLKPAGVIDRRAGVIPCGGRLPHIGNDRALLVGDAAGMVSPMTAGGIYPALRFGRRAGQLIASYLMDDGPQPAFTLARETPRYRLKRLQRLMLDQITNDLVWNTALGTRPMRALAQWTYFHRRAPGPRLQDGRDWGLEDGSYSADAGA